MTSRRQILQWTAAVALFPGALQGSWGPSPGGGPDTERVKGLSATLVDTSRDQILPTLVSAIRRGVTPLELLAALTLAGAEHVEPYPSVGFKYHTVMMLSSVYRTLQHLPVSDSWVPLLWAADLFKGAQQQDTLNGDWRLPPGGDRRLPGVKDAESTFTRAMEAWDTEAADAAIIRLVRVAPPTRVYEQLFSYGARDFRDIGHKAIAVSNSYRLLNVIGWEYAEPLLRSTVYALQNHVDEPNPAISNLSADRPWRINREHAAAFPKNWQQGRVDHRVVTQLLTALREESALDIGARAIEWLHHGVHPQSLWDAIILGAGELIMRASGIISVHANTSIEALRFAYQHVADDTRRRLLLLQGLSFITLFREMLGKNTRDIRIDTFSPRPPQQRDDDVMSEIFDDISRDRQLAAGKLLHYLSRGASSEPFLLLSRRYTVDRNTGYHDYKFTEAAFENASHLSPEWRDRYLSASVFYMNGAKDKVNPVVTRARALMGEFTQG